MELEHRNASTLSYFSGSAERLGEFRSPGTTEPHSHPHAGLATRKTTGRAAARKPGHSRLAGRQLSRQFSSHLALHSECLGAMVGGCRANPVGRTDRSVYRIAGMAIRAPLSPRAAQIHS